MSDKQEQIKIVIGLEYDKTLVKKYPDIDERIAKNNGNMCNVMYMEFDPDDDDMRPDQLACGHQFSAVCWVNYLKGTVVDDGAMCVFTKCPQLRCNVVVPHSFFVKYLINEKDLTNKYFTWHCKQFTDLNKQIKWCP